MIDHPDRRGSGYEWQATLLLALGFGLVALDRWIVVPLWPLIAHDLHLNYQDQGTVVGVLALAWGVFAVIFGRVSDGLGRRRVLIPAVILFSVLCGLTGVSAGLGMLIALRVLMGSTEGAFTPAAVAAVAEASRDERRGLNQGFMLSTFPLFGLGFGPILATQLLSVLPSWRWIFLVVALPGLIVAFLVFRLIREPSHLSAAEPQSAAGAVPAATIRWTQALGRHNVIVGVLATCACMVGVFTLSGMISSYLTDAVHLSLAQMGFVTSAIGFGGFFGEFMLPGLSDYIGRRWAAVLAFVLAFAALFVFSRTGQQLWTLFALLFICTFFCFGLLALYTGPVASEAVPPALIASAIGLVSGIGEIFGGGVGPALGGYVAQHYGIARMLNVAMAGLAAGALLSLFLRETAPRFTSASRKEKEPGGRRYLARP
ncbi:MAG TPA: MFS transporter [Steroidobacteraceae bacterium]|jgi:predicted MFS family arabinose efflux permease|nr:MFS transporter [Steroidobacteraceae bacterium]